MSIFCRLMHKKDSPGFISERIFGIRFSLKQVNIWWVEFADENKLTQREEMWRQRVGDLSAAKILC